MRAKGGGRSVWTKFARSSRQRRLGVVVVVVEGAFGEEGARERVDARDLERIFKGKQSSLQYRESSNP